jgi:hypothetical protein
MHGLTVGFRRLDDRSPRSPAATRQPLRVIHNGCRMAGRSHGPRRSPRPAVPGGASERRDGRRLPVFTGVVADWQEMLDRGGALPDLASRAGAVATLCEALRSPICRRTPAGPLDSGAGPARAPRPRQHEMAERFADPEIQARAFAPLILVAIVSQGDHNPAPPPRRAPPGTGRRPGPGRPLHGIGQALPVRGPVRALAGAAAAGPGAVSA